MLLPRVKLRIYLPELRGHCMGISCLPLCCDSYVPGNVKKHVRMRWVGQNPECAFWNNVLSRNAKPSMCT